MAASSTESTSSASGGIGAEVARQLVAAGWDVRALKRGGQQPSWQRDGITWIRGDAMNREEVAAAAMGCSVIVHAVNPAGYRRWGELVLPMVDNTIAAAPHSAPPWFFPAPSTTMDRMLSRY
jgi:nucleoside-diphosphate-sugar epimerase